MSKAPAFEVTERVDLGNDRIRLKGRFDFGTTLPTPQGHVSMKCLTAEIARSMAGDTVHRGGSLTITVFGDVIEIEARGPPSASNS